MKAIELGGDPPRALLEGTQEEVRALAPLLGADLPVTVGRDAIDQLAWDLSTYAAAVDWGGGGNSVGWLRGLRDRIEAVQGHLRLTEAGRRQLRTLEQVAVEPMGVAP